MIEALQWLGILILATFRDRRDLALENLALRQQLGVLKRRKTVPRLRPKDRVFWLVLSRIWPQWREVLHLIRANTVVGWQRKGFRIYWARISQRNNAGRPQVSSEARALIRKMASANPCWGAPRLHGELLKLGIDLSGASAIKCCYAARAILSSAVRTERVQRANTNRIFLGAKKTIRAEKTSLHVSALLTSPACWAGVLTSRPNFNAR